MKGIVFNLLEDFITENWSAETYEQILGLCPLETNEPFVGPGSYPDADLFAIVGKAVEILGVPLDEALRAFGRYAFPHLAAAAPGCLECSDAKAFLKSVETIIHVEVRKLYPDARPPRFVYEEPAQDRLIIRYQSERGLCPFMEGLLEAVAEHFERPFEFTQTECTRRGDGECVFDLRLAPVAAPAA